MTADEMKRAAAQAALKVVGSDVKIGLGTGSTANHFIKLAAEKVKAERLNTIFVPTSAASEMLAISGGLSVSSIEDHPLLDFVVDGADEIDPQFRMIKGGGGALFREKIVASSAKYFVCICDESKKVNTLGAFPLPIEVSRFGINPSVWKVERVLAKLNYSNVKMRLREGAPGAPFVTESGNVIVDLVLGAIPDPEQLDFRLREIPGVVETGLFIGIAGVVIFGTPRGAEEFTRPA